MDEEEVDEYRDREELDLMRPNNPENVPQNDHENVPAVAAEAQVEIVLMNEEFIDAAANTEENDQDLHSGQDTSSSSDTNEEESNEQKSESDEPVVHAEEKSPVVKAKHRCRSPKEHKTGRGIDLISSYNTQDIKQTSPNKLSGRISTCDAVMYGKKDSPDRFVGYAEEDNFKFPLHSKLDSTPNIVKTESVTATNEMSLQNAPILEDNDTSSQEVADCKDSKASKGSESVSSRHLPVQNLSNFPSVCSSEESCDTSIDRIHSRYQVRVSRLQSVTKKVSVSQISKCRSLNKCRRAGNHHRALEKRKAWKRRKIKVNQRSKDRLEKVENKRKKIVRYKTVQTKRENGSMAFACKLEETRKKSRKMEIRYNHWRRKRKEVSKNDGCKIRKRKKRYKSWRGKRRKKKQCNNLSMMNLLLVVVLVLIKMFVLNHRLIIN